MFNSPRPQRVGASSSLANGFLGGNGNTNNMTASFLDDPLAASTYDGLDPWSNAPTPDLPAPVGSPGRAAHGLGASVSTSPTLSSSVGVGGGSAAVFGPVIADASTAPQVYHKAFTLIDPTSSGETSVGGLSRVLATSGLSASTIERIVNLVSSQPRVTKHEFFVALALVALAQAGRDPSIEQVASLASQNALPIPTLDLDTIAPSMSGFSKPLGDTMTNTVPTYYRNDNASMSASMPALSTPSAPRRQPQHRYTSDDPWNTNPVSVGVGGGFSDDVGGGVSLTNGAPSSVNGTGMPREWWRRQERVQVKLLGPQGFILNRYMVYEISTDRGAPVSRRYSEFTFLWDCLVRRYPFRLLPQLPPKRIGADEGFLEQRRRGLTRFLNFVINHPIIKDDGFLAVFLTEPSLEQWRKHNAISLEEEAMTKRVDRVEEMSIPADLEEKLGVVRAKIGPLIEQWQKISLLTERLVKRREAAAADMSRLQITLNALNEVNETCWRGEYCELCVGVRAGLETMSGHLAREADEAEQRTKTLLSNLVEAVKSQRDLYLATRDLFLRHDRLSGDQVDRLKKRIESNGLKLEGIRAAQKEGWQAEVDRITTLIERDQATISSLLNRRVFIRLSMWHELRVVLHNRENALVTKAVREFSREEAAYAERVAQNWVALSENVGGMPFE